MIDSGAGSLNLLKTLLSKGFFCLGLGTACYLTYTKITHPTEAPRSAGVLERKVTELVARPDLEQGLQQVVQHQEASAVTSYATVPISQSSSEPSHDSSEPSVEPAVLSSNADAEPTPADQTDQNVDPNLNPDEQTGEVSEVEYPTEAAPLSPLNYHASNPDGSGDFRETASSNAEIQPVANQIPLVGALPPAMPRPVTQSGGGTMAQPAVQQSVLTSADLGLLTSAMRGVFTDKSESVSGTLCSDGKVDGSSCTKEPHYQVHTSRWAADQGLMSEVGFSVTGSSLSQLSGHLTLKIQNEQNSIQSYTLDGAVSGLAVFEENRSGRKFRVFNFTMSDLTLNSEKLSSVSVSLVFDVTGGGKNLSNESSLVFQRSKVQTIPLAWDANNPNRKPAAGEAVFIADHVQYSIVIEKQ